MFCPDCQTNLDEVPVDDPCPTCGGHQRSVTVTAGVATLTVASVVVRAVDAGLILCVLLALVALFVFVVQTLAGSAAATITAVLALVAIVYALRRAPSRRALGRALTWVLGNTRP